MWCFVEAKWPKHEKQNIPQNMKVPYAVAHREHRDIKVLFLLTWKSGPWRVTCHRLACFHDSGWNHCLFSCFLVFSCFRSFSCVWVVLPTCFNLSGPHTLSHKDEAALSPLAKEMYMDSLASSSSLNTQPTAKWNGQPKIGFSKIRFTLIRVSGAASLIWEC